MRVTENEVFWDWLGQPIRVGDPVIYPVSSGHAINMALAKVDRIVFRDDKVESIFVTPLERSGSRWVHATPTSHWVDNRTGKGIDPWSGNGKHYRSPAGYRDRATGDIVSYEEYGSLLKQRQRTFSDFEYIPADFKDYVERREAPPKSRKLTVIKNVTRIP